MADTAIMKGKDAISGSLAKCFVTIGNKRYNFMQAINVKAEMEKNKVEVPILGKTGKGNKERNWECYFSFQYIYIQRNIAGVYKNW